MKFEIHTPCPQLKPYVKHFVFRPLDCIDMSGDAALLHKASVHFVPEFYESIVQPVLHCELIGECFVDREYWDQIMNPHVGNSRGRVIEIHRRQAGRNWKSNKRIYMEQVYFFHNWR